MRRRHGRARGIELGSLSRGFDEAREQALNGMRSQARACGAHAVVDVRVRRERRDSSWESLEYVIGGTAVRFQDGRRAAAEPALSALSMDDFWKLLRAGHEPVGIAAASVVYRTAPSIAAMRALAGRRYSEGRATRELREFSDTVSGAIALARARAGERAKSCGADHVVGVSVDRELELVDHENSGRMPVSREPLKRMDLVVTVHVVGTAIRERSRERNERGTWRELDPSRAPRSAAVIELR
jgi:uncharacterized protein YbjQ (UPF0145 family)